MTEPKEESNTSGTVFWITGYPGAGKSTIASVVVAHIKRRHITPILLDGDAVRAALHQDLGYTPQDRLENAWRIARLAAFLSNQGLPVVVPTVSMYDAVREWLSRKASIVSTSL